MDFRNLLEHHQELISYMESKGYSELYIRRLRGEIIRILRNTEKNQWASYTDIYLEYTHTPHSKDYLRNKRTIIGAIEQFDLYGNYPNGRRRHSLFSRGVYHLLVAEFQELIDFYCEAEEKRGKKDTTIYNESHHAASFLLTLQKDGADNLEKVTEEQVISFFISEEGILTKSCSYKKDIAAVFKAGIAWNEKECSRILCFLPALRETRKNIQYLTGEEVSKIRAALDDYENDLTLRDRAIEMLLMYTGLRSCDVSGMTLDAVDWQNDRIHIHQQKTEALLELPISAMVGNAIYYYLLSERTDSDERHLFLSLTKPFTPLDSRSIGNITGKIMKKAGVRQSPGMRKGTHIFRHHMASALLGNGIPQAVISRTLGHTSPDSLEPYLRANFNHLKECALDISGFPVAEEVFEND
ncbi:tyrosine-type recombinase/integrase [Youngiibacter multivorans]|uniref:Integrase n=1 Tax=Youngiibacter multivorans TaxID=937251 RepID=A0ABS4G8C6_9CLOT|nr:tyrosine-type recombinase/integrase [Youngiibacter multivorans]MBP1920809.1 integrase [Youngiibacter multivorans]